LFSYSNASVVHLSPGVRRGKNEAEPKTNPLRLLVCGLETLVMRPGPSNSNPSKTAPSFLVGRGFERSESGCSREVVQGRWPSFKPSRTESPLETGRRRGRSRPTAISTVAVLSLLPLAKCSAAAGEGSRASARRLMPSSVRVTSQVPISRSSWAK